MTKKDEAWDKGIDRDNWTDKDGNFVANPLWQTGNVSTTGEGQTNISDVAPIFAQAKRDAVENPVVADEVVEGDGDVDGNTSDADDAKPKARSKESEEVLKNATKVSDANSQEDGVVKKDDGSVESKPVPAKGNTSNANKGTNDGGVEGKDAQPNIF